MLKKKDWILCSISTVTIMALISVGHRLSPELMLTVKEYWILAGVFLGMSLPFYVAYRIRKRERRETVEFHIEETVEEYIEELETLTSDIEEYTEGLEVMAGGMIDESKTEESPMEYLSGIQAGIESIASGLKDFRNWLEDYNSFYRHIKESEQEYKDWYSRSKKRYDEMVREREK